MPHKPENEELANVRLSGLPAARCAYIRRIDEAHANPRGLWRAMGEPEYLSPLQVCQLEAASCLVKAAHPLKYDGDLHLAVALPPQSVAAVTIEFD